MHTLWHFSTQPVSHELTHPALRVHQQPFTNQTQANTTAANWPSPNLLNRGDLNAEAIG